MTPRIQGAAVVLALVVALTAALTATTTTGCDAPAAESSTAGVTPSTSDETTIRSIAVRVHDVEAMVAFYREAFGITFREVETFGVSSRFGELAGITLKLVPIRASADFEGYPDLQLGLQVDDLERVVRIAERHGGRREGEVRREPGLLHGSVRDPDGNTLELYQRTP